MMVAVKVLPSDPVVSTPLAGEALQFWSYLLPFSYELTCKVLYSIDYTMRSHVAISFVMVTRDIR